MVTRTPLVALFASTVLLLLGGSANAVLVSHEFGGVLVLDENPWGPAGAQFTGTLTYETSTPSAFSRLHTCYPHSPPYDPRVGLCIAVDGSRFESDDNDIFDVCVSDDGAFGVDELLVAGFGPVPLFGLTDDSATAFSSEDLPTELSLADFDDARLFYQVPNSGEILVGTIDTLVVPEPSSDGLKTAALFLLALVARACKREGLPASHSPVPVA